MLIIHAHPRPSQSRVIKRLQEVLVAQPGAELRSLYELYVCPLRQHWRLHICAWLWIQLVGQNHLDWQTTRRWVKYALHTFARAIAHP